MPEAKNPGESLPDLDLPPADRRRPCAEETHHRPGLDGAGAHYLSGVETGQRVHADAQRGELALHAKVATGDVDYQGAELLQTQDKINKSFPRSNRLRQGRRANTATDPAPTEMFETVTGSRNPNGAPE